MPFLQIIWALPLVSPGTMKYGGKIARLTDVPGAYTLDPTNEAEVIARRILNEGADIVILVIDATALERNLVMAMQVLEHDIPVVIALNMVDEARHRGIIIDVQKLEEELGVPGPDSRSHRQDQRADIKMTGQG